MAKRKNSFNDDYYCSEPCEDCDEDRYIPCKTTIVVSIIISFVIGFIIGGLIF